MNIFGKKKESEEDVLIDRLTGSGDPQSPAKAESQRKGSTEANIEKLSAQISAVREVLSAQQERFERQSEEIGELRSALAERERQMRDIEAKALKASELLEEVQPEKLMIEQRKSDARIEAIKAKIENSEAVSGNIIEEIKKIKSSVSLFRGTEGLISLNKEVQEELKNIKKVEAIVEKHADRVEARFSSFEMNFGEFERMKDEIKNASDTAKELKKDVERNAAMIMNMPNKDELHQLKAGLENMLEAIRSEKSIYDRRNMSLEDATGSAAKKMSALEAELRAAKQENARNSGEIDEILELLERTAKIISQQS